MSIKPKNMKVGRNRGLCRIWLQGKYLTRAGFPRGEAYHVTYGPGKITVVAKPDGARHVAGTPDKPIMDIQCADVCESMEGAHRCNVSFASSGRITITPDKEAA